MPVAENETGVLVELMPSEPVAIGRMLLLKFALAGSASRMLAGTVNWLALPSAVQVNPAPTALDVDAPPIENPVIWTVEFGSAPVQVTSTPLDLVMVPRPLSSVQFRPNVPTGNVAVNAATLF